MSLEWKEIYSVNIKKIDSQHQNIFDLMNRLQSFEKSQDYKEQVAMILGEIEDYSIYHFKTEEDFFESTAYPDKDFHIKQHNAYKDKLVELKTAASERLDVQMIEDIFNFLKNWWTNHIIKTDMEYSEYFNQHGIF